jgi:hypothetical protein
MIRNNVLIKELENGTGRRELIIELFQRIE